MNEHSLAARLKSVKSYFLLNESDFLLNFMDLTENEMRMPMQGQSVWKTNCLCYCSPLSYNTKLSLFYFLKSVFNTH